MLLLLNKVCTLHLKKKKLFHLKLMLQNITQSYNNQNSTMVHQWIIDEWDRVSHPEKDS